MLSFSRNGTTRYFFFYQGKLYKTYDEIQLADGNSWGTTVQKALAAMADQFGAPGRVSQPDAKTGHRFVEYDWIDNVTHVRVIDRGATDVLVVANEDRWVAQRLATLPPPMTAAEMVNVVDPGISAILRGDGGTVDPNAGAADSFIGHQVGGSAPAPTGTAPGAPPPKKKGK